MEFNSDIHKRRSIRLANYDYTAPGAYFITLCTYQRECLFGDVVQGEMALNRLGNMVEQEWVKTAGCRVGVRLDACVVMPNHFHGILILDDHPVSAMGMDRRGMACRALNPFRDRQATSLRVGMRSFRWVCVV